MTYCNTLLDKYGHNICNLKYLDYYNVTPLMYACGYFIQNVHNYITAVDEHEFLLNYDENANRGNIFTDINKLALSNNYEDCMKALNISIQEMITWFYTLDEENQQLVIEETEVGGHL